MGLGQLIYNYQTLIAGGVAIVAAYIAARPVWHQLKLNQTQANGVLRDMLIDREADLKKARASVAEKIGRQLNDLDSDIGFDAPPQKLTAEEAFNHDLGISHALSWLRTEYPWRDSGSVDAARNGLIEKLEDLLNTLNEIHGPDHTEQVTEDYAISDEEWEKFVARSETAKDEVPDRLSEAQRAHREFLTSIETERNAIEARLKSLNETLALV